MVFRDSSADFYDGGALYNEEIALIRYDCCCVSGSLTPKGSSRLEYIHNVVQAPYRPDFKVM